MKFSLHLQLNEDSNKLNVFLLQQYLLYDF